MNDWIDVILLGLALVLGLGVLPPVEMEIGDED